METFYIVVLSVATAILIIILTYFGIILRSKASGVAAYPPKPQNTCPDYWKISEDGKKCQVPDPASPFSKNLGEIYPKTSNGVYDANAQIKLTTENTKGFDGMNNINFSDAGWTAGGKSGICTQKAWTGMFGVMWDGVSNYNGCG
jgi:hypothetical protein